MSNEIQICEKDKCYLPGKQGCKFKNWLPNTGMVTVMDLDCSLVNLMDSNYLTKKKNTNA